MCPIVRIEFTGKDQSLQAEFEIFRSRIALKWLTSVQEALMARLPYRCRFINLPGRTLGPLILEINSVIERLQKLQLPERLPISALSLPPSQEELNRAHHFFERCRGSIESPAEFFLGLRESSRSDLERMNELIHEIETYGGAGRVVVNFKGRVRRPLANEDYLEFRLNRTFGDLYVNYCMVGKTFLETYLSRDDHGLRDAIRPQTHYSSDFGIYVGENESEDTGGNFERWLAEHGLDPSDPKLALGRITVARMTYPSLEAGERDPWLRTLDLCRDLRIEVVS